MQQESIEVSISITGYFCNQWPKIKIVYNNDLLFDNYIIELQTLKFIVVGNTKNKLQIIHYDKKFGENNQWDTDVSKDQDRYVVINDIQFNDVSIGKQTVEQLPFVTNWSQAQLAAHDQEFIEKFKFLQFSGGRMSFNGLIEFEFTLPVYNWIIDQRFKVPKTDRSYFSDYSARWHYDRDIELLKEIKLLVNKL